MIDKSRRRNSNPVSGYLEISNDDPWHTETEGNIESTNQQQSRRLKYLLTILELLAFLMQLGVLVAIPILLALTKYFSPSGNVEHYVIATYILLPISLCVISFVWSGWVQNQAMKPSVANPQNEAKKSSDAKHTARFKTGKM